MHDTSMRPSEIPDLCGIIERYRGKPGSLLGILEEAQEAQENHYLPEGTLRFIADRTSVPLSQVYGTATFYSFFNLKPQGKHSIVVCRGTACHTRGSLALLEESVRFLGLGEFREEEDNSLTTADGFISVRTVACFGQCALAPVIQIDGSIRSSMTAGRLIAMLRKLKKGGKP
jgi:NADH-quinone oxidoreductase subunit E